MFPPARPSNEQQRLRKLHALRILDTEPERRFDRITNIARRMFDVQIALVSLIDTDRQWFKSADGLALTQTPRDVSFCGHAILSEEILVVPDAHDDVRFRDNPLVIDAPGIRFYAGCPLTLHSGHSLGTLCLMDQQPRMFSREDQQSLRDLADIVLREILAIDLATMDELTGVPNRRAFDYISRQALSFCRRLNAAASMVFFDMKEFKKINDNFGHAEGDRALTIFANALLDVVRASDPVGRLGGDEFVALLIDADGEQAAQVILRLRQVLALRQVENHLPYALQFSFGVVDYDPERSDCVAEMKALADQKMYVNKRAERGEVLA